MGAQKIEVKIISSKYEEIRKAILTNVDRGVTMLHGQTYIEIETGILNNLFKIRGGISIPPVEAPALITIAIATPTKTPAKSVLIKISSVK